MTAMKDWPQADRDALEALFTRAKAEGRWCFYGGIGGPVWLSPAELRAKQAEGKWCWGAPNWELRSPTEMIEIADRQIAFWTGEREAAVKRIAAAATKAN